MLLATGCSYHKITINKKTYGNLNLRYQPVFFTVVCRILTVFTVVSQHIYTVAYHIFTVFIVILQPFFMVVYCILPSRVPYVDFYIVKNMLNW